MNVDSRIHSLYGIWIRRRDLDVSLGPSLGNGGPSEDLDNGI